VDQVGGERRPGIRSEVLLPPHGRLRVALGCIGHAQIAGTLRVEDEGSQFAGEIERKALSNENKFAAGSDDDRAFVGSEVLLLNALNNGALRRRIGLEAGVFAAQVTGVKLGEGLG